MHALCVRAPQLPSNPSSDAVLRTPNPFPVDTVAACNEACLMEPFCVAFSVGLGEDDTSEQQQCTLYSSALGDTTVQSDTVTAFVQRCPVSFEGSAEGESRRSCSAALSRSRALPSRGAAAWPQRRAQPRQRVGSKRAKQPLGAPWS